MCFFHLYFFNMNISVNMTDKLFKCVTCIIEIWMDGRVSRDFDLGHSLNFMKCRNLD